MVASSVLGFPRIGASAIEPVYASFFRPSRVFAHHSSPRPLGKNREVKKAVEAYWGGKISADDLQKAAAEVRKFNWTEVKAHGVNFVPRYVFVVCLTVVY